MATLRHAKFLGNIEKKLQSEAKNNRLILLAKSGQVGVEPPLLRGDKIYPKMKQIVSKAQHEVLIMGYKMDNSDAEKDLVEALKSLNEKASLTGKKIRVRILINKKSGGAAIASNPTPDNIFKKGMPNLSNLDFQYAEHVHSGFGSYHSKMIVVDNEIAMLSSCDLVSSNNYKNNESKYVDVSTILHGRDFVDNIRQDFVKGWNSDSSEASGGRKKEIPKSIPMTEKKMDKDVKLIPAVNALYLSKKANGNIFRRSQLSPYTIALIEAINRAETSINVLSPNLNHPLIIQALAEAVKRNVKVNISLDKNMNDFSEAKQVAGGTNQQGIQSLYDAIMHLPDNKKALLDVRWATNDEGDKLVKLKDTQHVHARMICIDDEIVFAGSSVLDKQSVYHSRECDVVMHSPVVATSYNEKIFNKIFSKAKKINDDPGNLILTTADKSTFKRLDSFLDKILDNIKILLNTTVTNQKEQQSRKEQIKQLRLDLMLVKRNLHYCRDQGGHYRLLKTKENHAEKLLNNVSSKINIKKLSTSPPSKTKYFSFLRGRSKTPVSSLPDSKEKNDCEQLIMLIEKFKHLKSSFFSHRSEKKSIQQKMIAIIKKINKSYTAKEMQSLDNYFEGNDAISKGISDILGREPRAQIDWGILKSNLPSQNRINIEMARMVRSSSLPRK